MMARRNGANPVWYVDMTPGHDWQQARALDALRDEACGGFADRPAARLFPFCEPMGAWPSGQREFWWEREWRKIGDYRLAEDEIAFWLCPEDEIESFESFIREEWELDAVSPDARLKFGQRFVDLRWSVEEIIASLVGKDGATPFSVR
jgi:hypothetical protein